MQDIIEAHKDIIKRYIDVVEASDLENKDFLISFCKSGLKLTNPDKLSRWVGFIQGILFCKELIDIETERNFTRKIYKPIYENLGYDTSTVNVD